jgi:hypothetical protein
MSDRIEAALAHAAAPGTLAALHLAIKARMAVVAAAFPLLETKTSARPPTVIDGWLPPKEDKNAEQYPFLLVRFTGGNDSEQGADENATATFDIIIGTYSDAPNGWLDVVLVIDAIRADLGAAPAIAGTGFEHTGPLISKVPQEQTRPEWLGVVTTNWTIPRARRVEARNPEEG